MTRTKMLAVALGVWGLGAISASALAYDLGRAPTPRGPAVDVNPIHVSASGAVRHAGWQQPVLTISPITIVGHRMAQPPPAVAAPKKTEQLRDISRMHCADWRDLQMGSGQVQICE